MKKEDEILVRRYGRENPFKVPEGYFEDFTSRLMDNLPERNAKVDVGNGKVKIGVVRKWLYAAACVCAVAICATAYLLIDSHDETSVVAEATGVQVGGSSSDDYFDDAADYAMMDNQDMYLCMMDE